jgi:EAL domain-containing protein (putative c-di-GMP-specific phosphodiesterase class I)
MMDHDIMMECGVSVTADRLETASSRLAEQPPPSHGQPPDGRRVRLAAQRIEAGEQRRIAAHLAHALDTGSLRLQLQPRITLASGAIAGAEARLTMPHRRRGTIPLDDMIKSLAAKPLGGRSPGGSGTVSSASLSPGSAPARFGLIERINDFLLHEACAAARGWPSGWSIAVNIGAYHAATASFAVAVERELAVSGLAPGRLDLEIAETELVEGGAALRAHLGALHGLGIGLVLDDFGHAYASLGLLQRMKLVAIKLDRGLTRTLANGAGDRALLRAAIEIGHGLGIKITADGVETREQFDLLRDAGCDQAQGPWFSQTMPATRTPENRQQTDGHG